MHKYMCLLIAHRLVKQPNSFPTAGQTVSIPIRHQQSDDDNVRKRLEYGMSKMSIAEETNEQPSQVCVDDNHSLNYKS